MERTVGRAWRRVGAAMMAVAALTAAAGVGGQGALPAAEAADEPVLKIYDIGFVGAQHYDHPGASLRVHGEYTDPSTLGESGPGPLLTPEDLIEAIRTNFAEDSWADKRHSISAEGDLLLVVNRPPVLEAIQQYLTALRARMARQVEVEARLIELSATALAQVRAADPGTELGNLLSEKQIAALESALKQPGAARVVESARVAAFPGQRVHTAHGTIQDYVAEYNLEIAEKSVVARPIPAESEAGCVFDVCSTLNLEGTRLLMNVRFTRHEPEGAAALFDGKLATAGLMQAPVFRGFHHRSTIAVPLGGTALAGMSAVTPETGAPRYLALAVRARLRTPAAAPPAMPASAEKRQCRFFEVGSLIHLVPSFPGPALAGRRSAADHTAAVAGATFGGEPEDTVLLTMEGLLNLIQQNVAPESWSNARNSIAATAGGDLKVVQTPEVLTRIADYLAALGRDRGRVVTVEARLVELSGEAAASATGFDADPVALAALAAGSETPAGSGKEAFLLAAALAAGLNQQRFHVGSLRSRSYVKDYDVEVAAGSNALDPVVGRADEGFVLEVRPTVVGEGAGVSLELFPQWARLTGEPTLFELKSTPNAVLPLLAVDHFEPALDVMVREGEWTIATVTGGATAGTRRVLLVRATVAKAQ